MIQEHDREAGKVAGLGYAAWVVIYLAGIALAFAIYQSGLVSGQYAYLILFAPLVLVPAMTRAQRGKLARHGISSPALTRYSRRIMAAVLLMVAAIVGTVNSAKLAAQSPVPPLILAALVALPAIGCVWAMVRYVAEEEDEFLRHRAMGAIVFSLGFVLVIGALHGALQLFGLAPSLNSLWVLPAWAFGLGFGNLWHWMRGR